MISWFKMPFRWLHSSAPIYFTILRHWRARTRVLRQRERVLYRMRMTILIYIMSALSRIRTAICGRWMDGEKVR